MSEHRRAPRRNADGTIAVTNVFTSETAGRIGNLSETGMMLIARRPFPDGAVFQFAFELPNRRGAMRRVEIGFVEQWCEPANLPETWWVGLRIIDIGPEDGEALSAWVREPGRYA
jgi:hypothetical protein